MQVALNENGQRIYADSPIRYTKCFCQVCGEPLSHKMGKIKKPHFSHRPDSECTYGTDKDSKCPWHIHMQSLFPKETREVRFNDENGKVKYIADIYLPSCNTIIEFQHSPISEEDFSGRTMFHIQAGRRIVWIFDESKKDKEYGKLKKIPIANERDPFKDYRFRWNDRKVLNLVTPYIKRIDTLGDYSVCIDYGEDDIVHRIVEKDIEFQNIKLSVHPIKLDENMNVNEFFISEDYWLKESPWKELLGEDYHLENTMAIPKVTYKQKPLAVRMPVVTRRSRRRRF